MYLYCHQSALPVNKSNPCQLKCLIRHVSSKVPSCSMRLFFVRGLMYVLGGNKLMTLDLLGTRSPLWRARSIHFPVFVSFLPSYVVFPLRTFPMNIGHKYFQETNKPLFGFCLFFLFFFSLLRERGSSPGNTAAVGLCSRSGGEVIVSGFGLVFFFRWLSMLFTLPSIVGSLGKWVVLCFVFVLNYLYRQAFLGVRFSLGFCICL